jgi:hypothetical protein
MNNHSHQQEKKRPTVNVTCSIPNGLRISLHQVHEGLMGAKSQVPIGDIVELKGGANPGIDKEWFDAWLEENKNLSVVTSGQVTAADEEPEPREGVEDGSRRNGQARTGPADVQEEDRGAARRK